MLPSIFSRTQRAAALTLLAAAMLRVLLDWEIDPDFFWHRFFGFLLVRSGDFVPFDRFSFTAAGRPFTNHEWLSDGILGLVSDWSEPWGPVVLKISLVSVIFFALWSKLQPHLSVTRALAGSLIVTVLTPGLSFRPQLFSWVFLLVLFQLIERRRGPMPYFLLFAVWANVHGAWVLGIPILLLLAEQKGLALLGAILGSLCTPYGFSLWVYIVEELSNPISQNYISEWAPLRLRAREIPFLILAIVSTWGARGEPVSKRILLLLGILLGLSSVRHTPLLALFTLTTGIYARLERVLEPHLQMRVLAPLFFLAACAALSQLTLRNGIHSGEDRYPHGAVRYLNESGRCQTIWNPLHWGGFLLASSNVHVSIDGRYATLYPKEVLKAHQRFDVTTRSEERIAILEQSGAECVLFEAPFAETKEFLGTGRWQILFRDDDAVLLGRSR